MTELFKDTLASIRDRLAAREITSQEVVTAQLNRIKALNPIYHAYTQVLEEEALQAAVTADSSLSQGSLLGPLHGVPIAVKDLLDINGHPTSCASPVRNGHLADQDAFVIERLKAAGAVIIGKLNMTEFALSSYHPDLPVPVNPWNENHWSGASSSGSAVAAAAGLAYGTLGSDTGGSIRLPAAANGIVGIKPSFGAVSKRGAHPLAYTLDHIGPMTRTVEDAAIMLDVIQGYDADDPFSRQTQPYEAQAKLTAGVKGLRIGIDDNYIKAESDPQVANAIGLAGEVLQSLGAVLVPVNIVSVIDIVRYWGAVVAVEAAVAHKDTYPERASDYGPVFNALLGSSDRVKGSRIAKARVETARASQTFRTAFSSADMILCPSAPTPPLSLQEIPPTELVPTDIARALSAYTAPMNFTGLPTVSVPCGFSDDQLPIGLQLVGAPDSEASLVQAAYAYEQASPWKALWPPLDV